MRAETEKVELLSTFWLHNECKKMHRSATAAHKYIAYARAREMYRRKMSLRAQNSSLWKTALKQFGYESLHVELSCCLDVVVYMLKCVFW